MELEAYLIDFECDGDVLCGPPKFDLPPPPRPPLLDGSFPDCLGSCDNIPVVTSINSVQDVFQSIIIIIVSSIIIVMSVLLAAVLVWR